MKLKLACALMIVLASATPSLSRPHHKHHKHRRHNHGQPIREIKPSMVRLSVHGATPLSKPAINPTVGLDYSYNLNRYFAIGAHADSLINVNNFGLNLRAYLLKKSGAPYLELNGGATLGADSVAGASSTKNSTTYYANLLIGYEYRNRSGFTYGAAIGPGMKYDEFAIESTLFLGYAF